MAAQRGAAASLALVFLSAPLGAEPVPPATPYRSRFDLGLSGGVAYPICGDCTDIRWGPVIGGYAIMRPWPGFGFGFVYERSTFTYRLEGDEATGWAYLATPVMRGLPLRTGYGDVWVDAGLGLAGAETRFANGYGYAGDGIGGTLGAGIQARIGQVLRLGPYARVTGIGAAQMGECNASGDDGCAPIVPAHSGTWSLGLTVGVVLPGESAPL